MQSRLELVIDSRAAERDLRKLETSLGGVERKGDMTAMALNRLNGVVALMAGAFSIRQMTNYADGWSDMTSRVRLSIDAHESATDVMLRLADIADVTYSSLEATAESYTRNSVTLRALGKSTQEQLDYTEALNNALVVSGAKGQDFEMVQNGLSRAMAEGAMKGQELNLVLNYGTRVAELLADELGVNITELRGMAAQGKITGDVIYQALVGNMEKLREEAEGMPATVSDGFIRIGNSLQVLIGRIDEAAVASGSIAEGLVGASNAIRAAADPIVDNIDMIRNAAMGTAAIIGGRYAGAFSIAAQRKINSIRASEAMLRADVNATRAATLRAAETLRVAQSEQAAAQRALENARATAALTGNTHNRTAALHQLAVANQRVAGTEAALTTATNAQTAAMQRASIAARSLGAAKALLGGPVGIVTTAALAFWMFRDSANDVADALEDIEAPIDSVIGKFQDMAIETQRASLLRWGDAMAEAEEKAEGVLDSIESKIQTRLQNMMGPTWRAHSAQINSALDEVRSGARSLDEVITELESRYGGIFGGLTDSVIKDLRLLASEYVQHGNKVERFNAIIERAEGLMRRAGDAAEAAGGQINSNAPSAETINAWGRLNDRIRENIASMRDASALGAATRQLDAMGVTDPIMRSITLMLARQEDNEKRMRELRQQAARDAENAAREQEQIARQAAASLNTALSSFQSLRAEFDPLGHAQAEYNDQVRMMNSLLSAGRIGVDDYSLALGVLGDRLEAARLESLGLGREWEALLRQLDPVIALQEQYADGQDRINAALNEGIITLERYTWLQKELERSMLAQGDWQQAYGFTGAGSQLDAQQGYWDRWLDSASRAFTDFDQMAADVAENFSRGFGNAFERMIFDSESAGDALRNMAEGVSRSFVNSLGQMAGQWLAFQTVQMLAGRKTEAAAVAGAMKSGAAIAQAYAPAAAATSLATFGSNSIPAMTGIAATHGLSKAMAMITGFSDGGYTGPGGKYEPAGIVHAGEFVVRKEMVERPGMLSFLEGLNRGYASGGYVGPSPRALDQYSPRYESHGGEPAPIKITINNHSDARVTARRDESGGLTIEMVKAGLIRDMEGNGKFAKAGQHFFDWRRNRR